MAAQSEQALENLLIKQLESLEYERVAVMSENDLLANLSVRLNLSALLIISIKAVYLIKPRYLEISLFYFVMMALTVILNF